MKTEKNPAHTPGPWRIAENDMTRAGLQILTEEGVWVISRFGYDDEQTLTENLERARADARLIAAAPELLAALRLISASEQSMAGLSRMERGAIIAAIAKVEGR